MIANLSGDKIRIKRNWWWISSFWWSR
jgi:hypothetical protein